MNIFEKFAFLIEHKTLEAIELPVDAICDGEANRKNALNLANCYFERHAKMESPVISSSRNSFVGAHSYMNGGGYVRAPVFIGRYCSIGRRVTIGAGRHAIHGLSSSPVVSKGIGDPYSATEREILGITPNKGNLIVLNSDVWVGDGAVIMPGVTVGTGAVVGANAVVTKDVPPYAVVGGVAAKIIKYRFPDEIIGELLNTEWWNLAPEQLQLLPTENIFQFIDEMKNYVEVSREPFDTYTLAKRS
ncbi:virginiamycin A acetyltransferase [Paraburkholderia sp. Clong3]|uniref:CatB-related O-acetyltransferase n=1 Tax=Paraburkholderia sp. Clong3 TaxID=2991061 RepID=UPI003D257E0C